MAVDYLNAPTVAGVSIGDLLGRTQRARANAPYVSSCFAPRGTCLATKCAMHMNAFLFLIFTCMLLDSGLLGRIYLEGGGKLEYHK